MPRPVARKVSRLRWLVRGYVVLESIAVVALILGLSFWLALALDWSFEPRPAIRIAVWVLVALVAGWGLWKYLFSRLGRALPAESLALLIERQHPELGDGLVTSVQAGRQPPTDAFERKLVETTGERVSEAVRGASLWSVFKPRPLVGKALVAGLLLTSIGSFAMLNQQAFGFWLQRMNLSTAPWPRTVQLTAPAFVDSPIRSIARNDSFELEVLASIVAPQEAPDYVEIRYRLASGERGRDRMVQVGRALPGRDKYQKYRYQFEEVTRDLEFDVIGGDARLRDLKLRTVSRPAVASVSIACEYPDYLGLAPTSFASRVRQEIPEGTHAVCILQTTKPLARVRAFDASEQQVLPTTLVGDSRQSCQFDLGSITTDRLVQIELTDTDGVTNREPYRLNVAMITDALPEVSVSVRGVSTAVTPEAMVPLVGFVSDDYGINAAWCELQINQQPPIRYPVSDRPVGVRKITRLTALDLAAGDAETGVRKLRLVPGQKLAITVSADDAYNLGEGSRIASSPRIAFDVVTPSELRALLERRELGLRQRFEAIYEKMVGTRELLSRIEDDSSTQQTSDQAPDDEAQEGNGLAGENITDRRRHERSRLRITGARQNTTQLAYETLGVAEGFDEIVVELVNNRIDTEELKNRLESDISEPLGEVANQLMPQLEIALGDLRTVFDKSPEEAGPPLKLAQARADEVVAGMKAVLDRMLELESYNELVELLRGIVKEQDELRQDTRQQQKNKLRNLLED
ncbi:hypothetical protein HG15A2_27520 [Adhaeretor mobilis]|uniref:Polyketide synthase n=2 Tax=Adhaeretor mobilis TaxID=1930276 RepID=A0A517MX38_9BACT|nr:hypothetical protein HG15A2_27520 [Adhaeretor mobilis]